MLKEEWTTRSARAGTTAAATLAAAGWWSPSGRGGPTAGADPVVRASLAPLEQQKAMQ